MTPALTTIGVLSSDSGKMSEELQDLISSSLGKPGADKRWSGTISLFLPEPDKEFLERVRKALPNLKTSVEVSDRFWNSTGKSAYETLVLRTGQIPEIVPCVVYPTERDLETLLPSLKDAGISAVIRGGGTSVTGGLRRSGLTGRVAIDCRNLNRLDIKHNFIIVGSGVRGKELDEVLSRHGRTIGHYPESLRESSVGGWISAKSSGQESNQYGDIEDMVMSLNLYRSDFRILDVPLPREAAGISAKYIAIGGEGITGLIGNVAMKTHPVPTRRIYRSFAFRSFKAAVDFLSEKENFPTVVRLSDERETRFLLASAGPSRGKDILKRYMSLRSVDPDNFALMICVDNERKAWGRPPGSVSLGASLARLWEKSRYGRPEIGDELWRTGYVPDTLETSAKWEDIMSLYSSATKTFHDSTKEIGIKGILLAHISHLYSTGGAIYFTLILDHNTTPEGLMKVRKDLVENFVSSGGSISHHHGIGTYFASHLTLGKTKLLELLKDPVLAEPV